jgi:hypothetical protein
MLVATDVVEIVGRDQADAGFTREPDELGIEGNLLLEAVVLELVEEVVLAEDVGVDARDLARLLPVVVLKRLGDFAAEARGAGDQSPGIPGETLMVDP